MQTVEYIVYGKIMIDDIRLANGRTIRGKLGGGGPQAAFGARLWGESVGLLSRSGTDLTEVRRTALRRLDVDLQGWREYADIPTPRCQIRYDPDHNVMRAGLSTSQVDWDRLQGQPLPIPEAYRAARAVHLVTEYPDEPAVKAALAWQANGVMLSVEPLLDVCRRGDRLAMLGLLGLADIVTPDWPAASALANSDDPRTVLEWWSRLGPRLVAIRHGRQGSYLWDPVAGRALHVPALPVEVADPTGAGNAYGGGLCVGWQRSRDAAAAGCWATAAAAVLIRRRTTPTMSARLRKEAQELAQHARAGVREL